MKYSASALALGFFAALSTAAPTPGPPGLDFSQVGITEFTYTGSGCKPGTADISHSSDFQTLTVMFEDYQTTFNSIPTMKDCNINVQIHYPLGYQYGFFKTDLLGYAQLDIGVAAQQQSSYWFAGFPGNKPTFKWTWYGPYDNSYTVSDSLTSQTTIWSPCGASTPLNINTQLSLNRNKPNAKGLARKYQHIYGLGWRKCP